ncbi:3-oxoacyl-ACP reductase [Collimonas sp. OK412]|jgi:3-oxoacyl-[acyl-carrier protein] reductase|uniref:3-oxoacyl-ACP reductase n=1 Tax=Collimonas sp. (strain OK412) TaxID=1801619 RepID=UPI0008EBFBF6|nr:3-oxoacyl-ACP reductase [Collimonas sp. OK412]SFD27080.1 3-oxoacyl-[acyl-carrier protein] reductase [Collimonas sp. OK412]
MSDLLIKLSGSRFGAGVVKLLGMPAPVELARSAGPYAEQPLAGKNILLGRSQNGYAIDRLWQIARDAGALPLETTGVKPDILVMDATGCASPSDYRALYDFFHPQMRAIARNARVLIVAALPAESRDPVAAAAARGIEGFSRSLAKELGPRGATVNLAYVAKDAVDRLAGAVHFFCGVQTTYVTGQAVHVTSRVAAPASLAQHGALKAKVALVTGSARGIGRATAQRLAQEAVQVICVDVPAASEALHRTCREIGAIPLLLDITGPEAPRQLADFIKERFGRLNILVHNAGITRDKTLANMQEQSWDQVVDINLSAVMAIDQVLLAENILRDEARLVYLSSISGVSGNFGQTNYALTKAALIGYVAAQAPLLAARGICINAVAPGFIETAMTQKMPFMAREIGRRLNSVKQGGQPRDVAELVTFLCTPGACGISGDTIRVCGQGLVGA